MNQQHRWIRTASAIAVAAGCTGGSDVSFTGSVAIADADADDIVFSPAPAWPDGHGPTLDTEPALVLGPDLSDGRFFFAVRNIERLSDGRLIVENRGTRELLVFDSAGAFLNAWGGEPPGPDTFGSMAGLFRCTADSLMVVEHSPGRLRQLDSAGRFIRTLFWPALPPHVNPASVHVQGFSPDCTGLLVTTEFLPRDTLRFRSTGVGTLAVAINAFWISLGEPRVEYLGVFLGNEFPREGTRMPFGHAPAWTVAAGRIYYGWGDQPEIAILNESGTITRRIRWGARPAPITAREWESYGEYRDSVIDTNARNEGRYVARGQFPREEIRPYYGPVEVQRSAFLASDDGQLWVRHSTLRLSDDRQLPASRWCVFDLDGHWLGDIDMPPRFDLRSIRGGIAIGVWKDELDVEQVRGYRILPRRFP